MFSEVAYQSIILISSFSHRINTIMDYDFIVVLNEGKVGIG